MSSILLFALLGLGGGAVIALLALGVVGEYKASGVVNFAQGAIAMFCAYCFTELRSTGELVLPVVVVPHRVPLASHGLDTAPAVVVTVVYGAVFGVVVYLGIFRWLRRAPALAKVVASIGLMLTVQALAVIHFGTAARPSPRVLPTDTVTLFGATVGRDRLVLAGIAAVAAVALAGFYRYTRFGIVTRAVAQNERAAALLGWWPVRSEMASWAIASAARGARRSPRRAAHIVDTEHAHAGIVPALAAVLVADLSSFTVAAAAGLLIGVGQSLCVQGGDDVELVPAATDGRGLAVRRDRRRHARPRRPPAHARRDERGPHARAHRSGVARCCRSRCSCPSPRPSPLATSAGWRAAVIQSVITVCVLLSLVVLTGLVGQVSLAQAAFAGLGGFLLAKLLGAVGVPFPVGLLFAGLVTVPLGLLSACPRCVSAASTSRSSRWARASPSMRSCSATSRSPGVSPA